MANKPGLPKGGFSLKIPQRTEPAVQVKDYLDALDERPERRVIEIKREPSTTDGPPIPKTHAHAASRPQPMKANAGKKGRAPIPRKEFNLSPVAVQMVEELLDQLKEHGPQRDPRGSELFEALITAVYEAKQIINYQTLRPRGRWGTPTAKAFVTELKNIYQRAISIGVQARSHLPFDADQEAG